MMTPGSLRENDYGPSIPLKGYYSKNKYVGKHYILIVTIIIVNVKGDFGDFRIEFLGEFEAICKTASGP
jgi:hypothetical protein